MSQRYQLLSIPPSFWDILPENVMNGNGAIYDPILA
jgi:hypothetical protein